MMLPRPLVLLAVSMMTLSVSAFQAPRMYSTVTPSTVVSSPTSLFMSDQAPSPPEEVTEDVPTEDFRQSMMWKQIKDINNKFWDYTVNFFYVAISCGILLNMSGYGYQISLTEGITVMSAEEIHQERQWQEEMDRYDSELRAKQDFLKQQSMTNQ